MSRKTRKRTLSSRKRSRKPKKKFITLFVIALLMGSVVWGWQNRQRFSWQTEKSVSTNPEKKVSARPEHKAESRASVPESAPQKNVGVPLIQLFPAQVWEDDYHSIRLVEKGLELVSLGIKPDAASVKPSEVRPAQLKPFLLIVKKQKDENYRKEGEFNFEMKISTEAGIGLSALMGLPRITAQSFADLDGDKVSEIMVTFDTKGGYAEAVGILKLKGNRLEWVKTRDGDTDKIALWLQGTAPAESQEITWIKSDTESAKLLQKTGKGDPEHPEKGFVWKKVIWKWEGGVLKKQK